MAEMTEDSVPRLPRGVKLQLNPARKQFTLQGPERVFLPDEIAVQVLQRINGEDTVASIVENLAAASSADRDEVARDVIELLGELQDKGMVAV